MIYRSNLSAPDLTPYFKLTEFDHFGGHTFLADPDFDPRCGFFTHDEAALLYNIAVNVTRFTRGNAAWLDIGARTGWTAAHVIAAGGAVVALEPELYRPIFMKRAQENITGIREKYAPNQPCFLPWGETSEGYFAKRQKDAPKFDGFIIDGNHDEPEPMLDAMRCLRAANPSAVIVIHDFLGPATWQAADFLLDEQWKCKLYYTPNMIAVCWRGFEDSVVPFHRGDPAFKHYQRRVAEGFNLARCQQ